MIDCSKTENYLAEKKRMTKITDTGVCEMEEIRHGKWEYDSGDVGYTNYLCSECKNFLTFYEDIDLYPYFPYCGAKMDKE